MKALFAGSFNPFTVGHLNLVVRARKIFPEVCIAIGYNIHKGSEAELELRLNHLSALFEGVPGISVTAYTDLTAEAARREGAEVLIRGFRNSADAEYERLLADANREVFGIDTLLLPSLPSLAYISSSMVRELQHHGVDASQFLPVRADIAQSFNLNLNL